MRSLRLQKQGFSKTRGFRQACIAIVILLSSPLSGGTPFDIMKWRAATATRLESHGCFELEYRYTLHSNEVFSVEQYRSRHQESIKGYSEILAEIMDSPSKVKLAEGLTPQARQQALDQIQASVSSKLSKAKDILSQIDSYHGLIDHFADYDGTAHFSYDPSQNTLRFETIDARDLYGLFPNLSSTEGEVLKADLLKQYEPHTIVLQTTTAFSTFNVRKNLLLNSAPLEAGKNSKILKLTGYGFLEASNLKVETENKTLVVLVGKVGPATLKVELLPEEEYVIGSITESLHDKVYRTVTYENHIRFDGILFPTVISCTDYDLQNPTTINLEEAYELISYRMANPESCKNITTLPTNEQTTRHRVGD